MFLFSELLVLTRPVTRHERSCYQVYRQPLPIRDLALEDLQDGDVRMGGSFRGAFSQGEKGEELWSGAQLFQLDFLQFLVFFFKNALDK